MLLPNKLPMLLVLSGFAVNDWMSAGDGATGTIGVVASFDETVPAEVEHTLRLELERLLPIKGYVVEWRRIDQEAVTDVFERLVVVRFLDRCSPFEVARPADASKAFAFTHVSDGRVIPFVDVSCAQVLAARSGPLGGPSPYLALGRALARVLAHEIYHVLAETLEHGRQGLAKPSLTWKELTAPEAAFHADDASRIRAQLRPISLRASRTTRE
ncbi:MAG: hypothetical protein SFV54_21015 [Bryobacteraceae bacterium]|nr:hypothetical protein [Bryobacteraceae bacterium]